MNNVKLLPCPLCGSKAEIEVDSNYYGVNCTSQWCFYDDYDGLQNFTSYEEAANAWNRLAEEPVQIIDNATFTADGVMRGTSIDMQCKWTDENGNPIAEFTICDWWDGVNVTDLEVYEEYRGKGLSYKILDCAVKKCGARNLTVKKNNHIAKHVYDKYGFEVVDEDSYAYYMSYIEH